MHFKEDNKFPMDKLMIETILIQLTTARIIIQSLPFTEQHGTIQLNNSYHLLVLWFVIRLQGNNGSFSSSL